MNKGFMVTQYLVYLQPKHHHLCVIAAVFIAKSAAEAKRLAMQVEFEGRKVFERVDGYKALKAVEIKTGEVHYL